MKKIIVGFVLMLVLSVSVNAYTKEELYHRDGPLLTNAIVNVIIREINIIREELGLPERTGQQVLDSLSTELDSLPLYDWMK